MASAMALFSTTGIRGISNQNMTPEFALELAYTFGTFIGKGKKILIGRDTRTSSEMLKNSFVSGLLATGCDVFDAGIVPIPVINFCVKKSYDAGVMVTASHNPPEYNGIKFILSNGMEIAEKEEKKFEKLFNLKKFRRVPWDKIGTYSHYDALSQYKAELLKKIVSEKIKEKHFKVVLDFGDGAQALLMQPLLEELGCDVKAIHYSTEGFFARNPEPRPDTLIRAVELVLSTKADLGVAFDTDGDRAIFITDTGKVLMGDVTGSVLAHKILRENTNAKIKQPLIVTSVATSSLIDDIAMQHRNAKVIRTSIGANTVSACLLKHKALFGFEENGGCIFPEMSPARDGSFTLLKLLELLADENRKFSEIISGLPKYYLLKARIECNENKKEKVLQKIKKGISSLNVISIDKTDGLKLFFAEGWVLVRASGTEPVIRIFAESKDEKNAEALLETWQRNVQSVINEA